MDWCERQTESPECKSEALLMIYSHLPLWVVTDNVEIISNDLSLKDERRSLEYSCYSSTSKEDGGGCLDACWDTERKHGGRPWTDLEVISQLAWECLESLLIS